MMDEQEMNGLEMDEELEEIRELAEELEETKKAVEDSVILLATMLVVAVLALLLF